MRTEIKKKLASLFGVTVSQLENQNVATSKLSFAFRGSEFSVAEMEAVSAINKIALNSEFMRVIIEGGER